MLQDFDGNLSTTDDQRESAYTYDAQGRLIAASTAEGTIHHEYDSVTGLLTRTWSSLPGQSSVHTDTQYAYDALGRLSTVTVTQQHGVELTADDITLYSYDAVGNLSLLTLANGLHTQYLYDNLNRLVEMVQFEDHASNGTAGQYDESVDTLIASYEYTLDDAGNRIQSIETDDLGQVTTIDWQYDALNRLVYESYDSFDNAADYTHTYAFDLTGNRVKQSVWDEAEADVVNTVADEYTTYQYDASDRLTEEIFYEGSTATTQTTYTYTAAEQTGKEVVNLSTNKTTTRTQMSYDLQGRLSQIVIEQLDENEDVVRRETQGYLYNAPGSAYAAGIRVQQTSTIEAWDEQTEQLVLESETVTTYLVDGNNPTGYAQTLVERVYDGQGNLLKEHNYTIGHDVHGQSTLDAVAQTVTAYFLLTDGHGSVRQFTDALANIIQRYAYAAYGNMLTPTGYTAASAALTHLLYSGESFNTSTGLQYLRARYYDPSTGRFNRLDPFAGNQNDPQSLHKYLYTHGNPVMGIDPSGEFSIIEFGIANSISVALKATAAVYAASILIRNTSSILGRNGQFVPVNNHKLDGNSTSIIIQDPKLSAGALFSQLTRLSLRNLYPVASNDDVTGVGHLVTFDMSQHGWGILGGTYRETGQGDFSVKVTKYDPRQFFFVVRTLIGHPLAGWRRFEVNIIDERRIEIKTYAVEHAATSVDSAKIYFGGGDAVKLTWKNLMLDMLSISGGTMARGSNIEGTDFKDNIYAQNLMVLME